MWVFLFNCVIIDTFKNANIENEMLNSNVRQDNQSQEQTPNFQHHYYGVYGTMS